MSSKNVVRFNPEIDVENPDGGHTFSDGYVVKGRIALSDVTFRYEDDMFAPRDVDSCPLGRENLIATSSVPPLHGYESSQHLKAPCQELAAVIDGLGADETLYSAVCARKVVAAGLDITSLPAGIFADEPGNPDIKCPFSYMKGKVEGGESIVPVVVDVMASGPEHLIAYRTVIA